MSYNNDGELLVSIQPLEDAHDLDRGARVERSRWFVRKNDGRVIDERSRKGNTLLLATGQLARHVSFPIGKAHFRQRRLGTTLPLRRAQPRIEQGELYVFQRRGARHEIETLKDE